MLRSALAILIVSLAFPQEPQRGVTRLTPPALAGSAGRYFALLIGINDYPSLPKLQTAVNDAKAMESVLRVDYGFHTELLLERAATHDAIVDSLSRYRTLLGPDDNLLIYYAGHGHKDPEANRTYWLPFDSGGTPAHWISDQQIADSIGPLPARHVLLISDSCYSGGLSLQRDAGDLGANAGDHEAYLRRKLGLKSRTVISSGGDEPVSDGGPGGHSVFTAAILSKLGEKQTRAFSAENLYQSIQEIVVGGSRQTPQFAPIRDTGHNAGDFIFFPAGADGIPVRLADSGPSSAAASGTTVNRVSAAAPPELREKAAALPPSFFGYKPPNSSTCVRVVFSRTQFPSGATGPSLDSYLRDYLQAVQRSSDACVSLQILRLTASYQDNQACGNSVGILVNIRYEFQDLEGSRIAGKSGSVSGLACYDNDPAQTEKLATEKAIANLRDAILP